MAKAKSKSLVLTGRERGEREKKGERGRGGGRKEGKETERGRESGRKEEIEEKKERQERERDYILTHPCPHPLMCTRAVTEILYINLVLAAGTEVLF